MSMLSNSHFIILTMFSIAAYEYHRNKVYMSGTRQQLRDALDPFDIPDERLVCSEFS